MAPQTGLVVSGLTVRFGGLLAVDDVSLRAGQGVITGLIGPNGAGKSTTFNACSGLVRPSKGRVELAGVDITRAEPSRRARLGLGRTFQRVELCDSLTTLENVALGCEARRAGSNPWRHVWGRSGEWKRSVDDAVASLERCGIAHLAGRRAGDLSTGQRRLVELARVIAGGFSMLLLDEPSSGLDPTETEEFGRILAGIVREEGRSALLVEHDMALVMAICAHIYVLEFGRLIFEGTPDHVASSPVVRTAYLGSEAA